MAGYLRAVGCALLGALRLGAGVCSALVSPHVSTYVARYKHSEVGRKRDGIWSCLASRVRVVKVKIEKESADNTRAENVRKGYVWCN